MDSIDGFLAEHLSGGDFTASLSELFGSAAAADLRTFWGGGTIELGGVTVRSQSDAGAVLSSTLASSPLSKSALDVELTLSFVSGAVRSVFAISGFEPGWSLSLPFPSLAGSIFDQVGYQSTVLTLGRRTKALAVSNFPFVADPYAPSRIVRLVSLTTKVALLDRSSAFARFFANTTLDVGGPVELWDGFPAAILSSSELSAGIGIPGIQGNDTTTFRLMSLPADAPSSVLGPSRRSGPAQASNGVLESQFIFGNLTVPPLLAFFPSFGGSVIGFEVLLDQRLDLSQVAGAFGLKLNPKSLPKPIRAVTDVTLKTVGMVLSLQDFSVLDLSVTLAWLTDASWTLIKGLLEVRDFEVTLSLRDVALSAVAEVTGQPIVLRGDLATGAMLIHLEEGKTLDVEKLVDRLVGKKLDLDSMRVTQFFVSTDIDASFFNFRIRFSEKWRLLSNPKIVLKQVGLIFNYTSGEAAGGSLDGTIQAVSRIGKVDLQICAELATAQGFTFSGSTIDQSTIDVTDLVKGFLGEKKVPSYVPDVRLSGLVLGFNTASKDFHFEGDIEYKEKFRILGRAVDLKDDTRLSLDYAGGTVTGYVESTLDINDQELKLKLLLQQDQKFFTASWLTTGKPLELRDLIDFLSAGLVDPQIAFKVFDLNLTAAGFSYDSKQRQLVLSARSASYGNFFFVVGKDGGVPTASAPGPTTTTGTSAAAAGWQFAVGLAIDGQSPGSVLDALSFLDELDLHIQGLSFSYSSFSGALALNGLPNPFPAAAANVPLPMPGTGTNAGTADPNSWGLGRLTPVSQLSQTGLPYSATTRTLGAMAQGTPRVALLNKVLPAQANLIQNGLTLFGSLELGKSSHRGIGFVHDFFDLDVTAELLFSVRLTNSTAGREVLLTTGLSVNSLEPESDINGKSSSFGFGVSIYFVVDKKPDDLLLYFLGELSTTIKGQPLTFDIQLGFEENSFFIAGDLRGNWNDALGIKGLTLANVAVEIGVVFQDPPLPSFGLAGEIAAGRFDGSFGIFVLPSEEDPKVALMASIHDLSLADVLDGIVHQKLPSELAFLQTALANTGVSGLQAFTIESSFTDTLDQAVISSDLSAAFQKATGRPLPTDPSQYLVHVAKKRSSWLIVDYVTHVSYELFAKKSGIAVRYEAQLYFVPDLTGIQIANLSFPFGFRLTGKLNVYALFEFSAEADIELELGKGLYALFAVEPLSLFGGAIAIAEPEKDKLPGAPTGGPVVSFSTLHRDDVDKRYRDPHFMVAASVGVLGIEKEYYEISITDKGWLFEFDRTESFIVETKVELRLYIKGLEDVDGEGSLGFDLDLDFDLGTLGKLKLADVAVEVDLELKYSHGLKVEVSGKIHLAVGSLDLIEVSVILKRNASKRTLDQVPTMVKKAIEKQAGELTSFFTHNLEHLASSVARGALELGKDLYSTLKALGVESLDDVAHLADKAGEEVHEIVDGLESSFNASKKDAAKALRRITKSAEEVGDALMHTYRLSAAEAGAVLNDAGYAAKDVLRFVRDFKGDFDSFVDDLDSDAGEFVYDLESKAAFLVSRLDSDVLDSLASELEDLGSDALSEVLSVLSDAGGKLESFAEDVGEKLEDAGKDLLSWL